jgi:putative addiction module component (TIGR02574 family)
MVTPEILEMTIPERIQLVADIWDSIAAHPESVPITDAQREELNKRLDSYYRNPLQTIPWEEVKKRISQQK